MRAGRLACGASAWGSYTGDDDDIEALAEAEKQYREAPGTHLNPGLRAFRPLWDFGPKGGQNGSNRLNSDRCGVFIDEKWSELDHADAHAPKWMGGVHVYLDIALADNEQDWRKRKLTLTLLVRSPGSLLPVNFSP